MFRWDHIIAQFVCGCKYFGLRRSMTHQSPKSLSMSSYLKVANFSLILSAGKITIGYVWVCVIMVLKSKMILSQKFDIVSVTLLITLPDIIILLMSSPQTCVVCIVKLSNADVASCWAWLLDSLGRLGFIMSSNIIELCPATIKTAGTIIICMYVYHWKYWVL